MPSLTDQDSALDEFLADVQAGLAATSKQLKCKYLYDQRGSQLFDRICELPEYYLTRTEQSIMDAHAADMADQLGESVMLIEFGSGSSKKTQVLLDHLHLPAVYVPLDISEEHLLETAEKIQRAHPKIEVLPLVADFTKPFDLPEPKLDVSHAAVYFPGSTIGNFTQESSLEMLERIAQMLGPDGGLLLGIDLQKDPATIEAAYNDSANVTSDFSLNLLHRINRELDADFEIDQFRHEAVYNESIGRVEICLVSNCAQTVTVGEEQFQFEQDEQIQTEYSYKYNIEDFAQLASEAGFTLRKTWTDANDMFAVLHLVRTH